MKNPFLTNSSSPKPRKQVNSMSDSVIESLRDIGSSVGGSAVKDVAGSVAQNAFDSLLGIQKQPSGGEIRPNSAIEIAPKPKEHTSNYDIQAEMLRRQDREEMTRQIQAVREELKALAESLEHVSVEIEKTIDQAPIDPGVYHLTFYDRLLALLRDARIAIEDSRSWNQLASGRKQKKSYWGMYKKHGTKFGLSSERTAATQVG